MLVGSHTNIPFASDEPAAAAAAPAYYSPFNHFPSATHTHASAIRMNSRNEPNMASAHGIQTLTYSAYTYSKTLNACLFSPFGP
jgi:hypothetical protein